MSPSRDLKNKEYRDLVKQIEDEFGHVRERNRPQNDPKLKKEKKILNSRSGKVVESHPFESQIRNWRISEPQSRSGSIIHKRHLQLVTNDNDFTEMMSYFKQQRVIGVDLEHNTDRSYHGMVCLIQIATRDTTLWITSKSVKWSFQIEIFISRS